MSRSNATPGERAERSRRRTTKVVRDHRDGKQAATTAYSPEQFAFRFPNEFVNFVWSGRLPPRIWRKVEIKTTGRCGGMAFASLDFFHLDKPVPALEPKDFSRLNVPHDGHPLADYIYSRQLHSMLTRVAGARDGLRFLRWSGRSAGTVFFKTANEEKKAIESLNRGEPVVLGLIGSTSRSLRRQDDNHQVVCYGYRTDARGYAEFFIYDPNEPFLPSSSDDYEVILTRTDDYQSSGLPYKLTRRHQTNLWRGFFVQRYSPRRPSADVINARGTAGSSGNGGTDFPDPEGPPVHPK